MAKKGKKTKSKPAAPFSALPAFVPPATVLTVAERRKQHAEAINASWRSSVEGIIEAARRVKRAKDDLPYGEFQAMVDSDLDFDRRTAQCLMAIGRDPVISDATHASLLPPQWTTLYELTKLDKRRGEGTLLARIEDGTITPKTQRKHVAEMLKDRHKPPRDNTSRHANARRNYIELLKFLKTLAAERCREKLVALRRAIEVLDLGCTISVESPEEVSSDSSC